MHYALDDVHSHRYSTDLEVGLVDAREGAHDHGHAAQDVAAQVEIESNV